MRSLLAAAIVALPAGIAWADQPLRFRAPELVAAIVQDELRPVRARDRLTADLRAGYVDGFAAILHHACPFLPRGAHSALRGRIDAASAGRRPDDGVVAAAAAAGIADGRTFTDRFACAHPKMGGVRRNLAALLDAQRSE